MDLLSSTCHAVWTSEGGSTAARPCTEPQSQDPPWGHTGRKSRHILLTLFFYYLFLFLFFYLAHPGRLTPSAGLVVHQLSVTDFQLAGPTILRPRLEIWTFHDKVGPAKCDWVLLGGWQQMNVIWLAVTVNVGDCRSRTWRCASGKQHHQACYLGPWDLVLRSPGKKAFKQTWTFGTAWTMTFWTIVDIF